MNYLNNIEVNNLIVFKHASFPILPGINTIRGENKDSTTVPPSANAVGKSLLFASVANACLHAPPMSEKKNSANTFMPSGSSIKLDMVLQNQPTVIKQSAKSNSITYDIVVDGKNQKVRTATQMRAEVTKLFGVSENIVYSTMLVSTLRPSLLWQGTSAQRYDFFEDIAELGYYDAMAAKISKKISEIKVQEKVMLPWAAELDDLRKIYTGPDQMKGIKKQLKVLQDARGSLHKSIQKLAKAYAKYDDLDIPHLSKRKAFSTPSKALQFYEDQKQKLESTAKEGRRLSAQLEKLNKQRLEHKEYCAWHKKVDAFPEVFVNPTKKKIEEYEFKVERCLIAQRLVDRFEEELQTYKDASLEKLQGPRPEQSEIKKLRQKIEFHAHQKTLFKKWHDTGICPLCLSRDRKAPDLKLEDGRKKLLHLEHLYLKYQLEDNTDLQKAMTRAQARPMYERLLRASRKQLDVAKERQALIKNGVPAVKPIDKKQWQKMTARLEEIEQKFKDLKRTIKQLEPHIPAFKMLESKFGGDIKIADLSNLRKKARTRYEKMQTKLNRLEDEYLGLRSEYNAIKQARRTYKRLNKKYQAAKLLVAELPDWQILHKMYGPTGMRIMHMQSLVATYVEYLNNMAPLVFSEPVKFSFRLEGRAFDLLVTRHGMPSDVRYLSGAQSRFFFALSAVALRKMLPESKRFNLIVFDEIDSAVSTSEMLKFTTQFLPFVAEEIPSIYILTPKNKAEWHVPGARDFIFTRSKGFTKIKTEQELQLAA